MTEETLLSQEGYDKLEAERDYLISVKRKEVSERLKEAISYGDLSENAEYDAAKNEQAEVEDRIFKLENIMRTAKVMKKEDITCERVTVGVNVTVEDMDTGEQEEFSIVGATEADPFAEPAKISSESEVCKNLMDKKVGEVGEAITPDGPVKYKIKKISVA